MLRSKGGITGVAAGGIDLGGKFAHHPVADGFGVVV